MLRSFQQVEVKNLTREW